MTSSGDAHDVIITLAVSDDVITVIDARTYRMTPRGLESKHRSIIFIGDYKYFSKGTLGSSRRADHDFLSVKTLPNPAPGCLLEYRSRVSAFSGKGAQGSFG